MVETCNTATVVRQEVSNMAARNPFTPTFGMVPFVMAGRDQVLSDMKQALEDGPGNPNLSTILIGPRGTGKTALLSCIADEARSRGWLAVNAVANDGMLEDIVQQAGKAAAHLVDPSPSRHLSAIGVGQLLSLEWVFDQRDSDNWRSRMEALLDQIEARDSGLLITVDEVRVEVEEMVKLVSTYQLFIRDGRRVGLVMAGLPMHVTDLIDDERVTFLRRARQRHIGRIEDKEIRQAILETLLSSGKGIDDEALSAAVEASGGFMWIASGGDDVITTDSASRGIAEAQRDFTRGVLEASYREMSKGDRAFARAMLPDKHGSRLADVAKRLGKSTGYASTYKRRLMKQGIIGERPGNTFDFDIPLLRELLSQEDE